MSVYRCQCDKNCPRLECQPNRATMQRTAEESRLRAASHPAGTVAPQPERCAMMRPMMDPRMQEAVDQLTTVHEEFEIAIAWADRPGNDGNPIIFGRNLRQLERMLAAALLNLQPAPADTLPAIIARHRVQVNDERREQSSSQLSLTIPPQSRPAFANKAGAR